MGYVDYHCTTSTTYSREQLKCGTADALNIMKTLGCKMRSIVSGDTYVIVQIAGRWSLVDVSNDERYEADQTLSLSEIEGNWELIG